MESIKPVRPVAPFIGGKRNLAKTIVARIEAVPHGIYAEPFVGMAGVFLRRRSRPKSEVINDANREIATFFRVLQRHYVAFLDMVRFQITSRSEFERLVRTDPSTLTDLERAARFLYVQRQAFSGLPTSKSFAVTPGNYARFDITKLRPMLEDVHERLAGVVIECLDFGEFIERYDRPQTLFYLDPPYWGRERLYGRGLFTRDDFTRLEALLRGIEGRFILSLNDTPEVRELFGRYTIEPVKTTYTAPPGGKKLRVQELLITGGGP